MGSSIVPRYALGFLVLACVSDSLFAQSIPQNSSATLYLTNGDYVAGQFDVCESSDEIRWRTPLFEDALRFDVRGVDYITYVDNQPDPPGPTRSRKPLREKIMLGVLSTLAPTTNAKDVTGSRIDLVSGDVLFGDVVSLDEDHLIVRSARHGDMRIRREYVAEVDGLSDEATLLFDGTANLSAWTVLGGSAYGIGDWSTVGRELVTEKVGANLYYRMPEQVRSICDLKLAGKASPDFRLVFGAAKSMNDIRSGFSIETWGKNLVIHRQSGDEVIHKVIESPRWKESDWTLSLQICFDPAARRISVLSDRRLLGEMVTDDPVDPTGTGFLIRNHGLQLRVAQARLRRWVGPMRTTAAVDGTDVVVLTDGSQQFGRIASLSVGQDLMTLVRPDGNRSIPVSQVDRMMFAGSERRSDASDDLHLDQRPWMQVAYTDGGGLQGRYRKIDKRGILLNAPFSDEPVWAGWMNLLDIQLTTAEMPDDPSAKNGLIEDAGCRLHGRILNGDRPSELLWQPVMSEHGVVLLGDRTARIIFEPCAYSSSHDPMSSELSLTNGDVIPCEVDAVDDQFVHARFAGGQTSRIPVEYFKALRVSRPGTRIYNGFAAGDRWYANSRDENAFQWQDGAGAFQGKIMLARELKLPDRFRVSFDVKFGDNVSLIVGVGADTVANALERPENLRVTPEMLKAAAEKPPDGLIEVSIIRQGRRITARGISRVAGVLGMIMRANVWGVRNNQNVSLTLEENASAHIDLLVDRPAREYKILANGKELYRWRDPTPLVGNVLHVGIAADPQGRPTPQGRIPYLRHTSNARPHAVLYNFVVDRWPGAMKEEHRDRFLTRRRGASEKSLTHAIRAVNGDSLRGRFLRMTDDTVEFQTRLETLSIPRDSIVEIISLGRQIDLETLGHPSPHAPALITMWGGATVTLDRLKATDRFVLGESATAGLVALPREYVSSIRFGSKLAVEPPFADWVLREPPPLPTFDDSSQAAQSDWLDKPAPDFKIKTLDGDPVSLSDLRGRPVILDFWATWCGPCIASMPTMMEIADKYSGRVDMIAVNQQEDPAEVRDFVESRLWQLHVGLDEDGSLGRLFGVNAIPYTMIIDQNGIVRHVHIGATPDMKREISAILDTMLAE